MIMRHHPVGRNIELGHERGGQLGGTINGTLLAAGVAKFANLDGYARTITGPVVIGVFALYIQRKMLNGPAVIDSEMPCQITRAVPFGPAAECTSLHSSRVLQCRGVSVSSAVDSDICGPQRKLDLSAEPALIDEHLKHIWRPEK